MLGKVNFDEHVNVLERYCKGDIYIHLQNLNVSLFRPLAIGKSTLNAHL